MSSCVSLSQPECTGNDFSASDVDKPCQPWPDGSRKEDDSVDLEADGMGMFRSLSAGAKRSTLDVPQRQAQLLAS